MTYHDNTKNQRIKETENSENDNKFKTSYYRKTSNFRGCAIIPNETGHDPDISLESLGFITHVFSNSETWEIIPKYIAKMRKKDSLRKIYRVITELIQRKYAVRLVYREKGSTGKFQKQHFGYHFFCLPASDEDIQNAQNEFIGYHQSQHVPTETIQKKSTVKRKTVITDNGNHTNRNIEQQELENTLKETTTPLPSSNDKKYKWKIDDPSLPLFHPKRKYFRDISEDEIRMVQMCYEKTKATILNPEGWITQCVREGWYRKSIVTDEDLQRNFAFASRIEQNFQKLGFNGGRSFLDVLSSGMALIRDGKEVPLPPYEINHERFKELVSHTLIGECKYPEKIFD